MRAILRLLRTKKISTTGTILLVLAAALTWIMYVANPQRPVFAGTPAQVSAENSVPREIESIWREVLQFRQLAMIDYRHALTRYASDMVREKFAALDQHVWAAAEPRIGWSFFMTVSVFTLAAPHSPFPLVAFYNPWSDVYLVTAWNAREQPPKVVDAEILVGDWIRNHGKPPFNLIPLWRRGTAFLPAALGRTVGESAKTFESLFHGWTDDQWRSRVNGLDDERMVIDVNYAGAALMLGKILKNIDNFLAPAPDEPEMLSALRLELALVRKQIMDGNFDSVLASAPDTLPVMKELARTIPVETYRTMGVVSTVIGRDDAIAFLIDPTNADYCLSFYFRGDPDALSLQRLDVDYYPGWYHEAAGDGTTRR